MKTVKIVNKDAKSGYTIINEDDFDPKTQKKYVEPKAKAAKGK